MTESEGHWVHNTFLTYFSTNKKVKVFKNPVSAAVALIKCQHSGSLYCVASDGSFIFNQGIFKPVA